MTISPLARPVYVMAKPVGSACNLACDYCYYSSTGGGQMSDALLENFIRQYIEMQTTQDVLFTWHGGEPTLRGLDFYRRVVALQRRYAGGRHIDNALQTNGTLLTEDWCRFLHDEGWLVGISIDGPEDMHNALRHNRCGKPTWAEVMRSVEMMQRFDVQWNAMATINTANVLRPEAFYRFFCDIGCDYLQFTPVAEGETGCIDGRSWGSFLCGVFDVWVRRDVGRRFVQIFDATLAMWMGVEPGVCVFGPTCGHAAVIEADGSVYSCDHFAYPSHRLGRLGESADSGDALVELLYGERQAVFGQQKADGLTDECRRCPWLFACHGECPRLRRGVSADGQGGHNVLCAGYKRYFEHVAPAMEFMRRELLAERPPANVMRLYR